MFPTSQNIGIDKKFLIGPKMTELRAFNVNLSKIPNEPLEVVFAHCAIQLAFSKGEFEIRV